MQSGAQGQHGVVEIVTAVVQKAAAQAIFLTLTQAHVGAGLGLQHERKIFCPHARLQVAHHLLMPHQALRHIAGKPGLGRAVDGGRVAALVSHLRGRAKADGHRLAELTEAALHQRLHHRAEAAHRANQGGTARHHAHGGRVAGAHRADADHRAVYRLDIARNNALHRRDDVRGHQHRVDRGVGVAAMAALAGHLDGDAVGRGHHGPRVDAHGARAHGRPVVHAKHRLHGKTLKQAVLDHRPGTRVALFAGLKNQHRCAIKLPCLGQVTRRRHQHGGVPVVAATVHQTGLGRFMGKVVVLGHGQGIHVGAQAHHLAARRAAPTHHGHQAGLANAGVDFVNPAHLQRLPHPSHRVVLLKAEFRVGMQITPQSGDLGVKSGNMRKGAALNTQSACLHLYPPA